VTPHRFGRLDAVAQEFKEKERAMTEAGSSGTAAVTFPGDTQIMITREFDAPRHLVYTAWTTPELIEQWWSGDRGKVTLAEVDLRDGGTWRYDVTGQDGSEVTFHGVYREILPDERIIWTEMYKGMPEAGAVNTATFDDQGGRTALMLLVQHANVDYRAAHIESGVEASMQEAMDRLEQVVVSLREDDAAGH
jgi:uncharacterized protein YndB with AHSA1/START domain